MDEKLCRSGHVYRAMRTLGWVFLLALVASLSGCRRDGAKTPDPKVAAPSTGITTPTLDGPKIPPSAFEIGTPGKQGWAKTDDKLVQLGQRMDQVLIDGEPMLCRGEIVFSDPSVGDMQFKAEVRVKDDKDFHIEFVMPETGSSMNRMIGDGTRRVVRKNDEWIELQPFTHKDEPDPARVVSLFPRGFPEEMFAHYRDGSNVWSTLFQAWQSGVGGYSTTFEEQTFKAGGKNVTQYRIQAKTKKSPATEIEIMVDKKHSLPLTIRVNGTLEDGRKFQVRWTATWSFGGTYDAKTFEIPVAPKA